MLRAEYGPTPRRRRPTTWTTRSERLPGDASPQAGVRHDEQLGGRLGVAVFPVRPVRAVEVDARRDLVLVEECLVEAELAGRRQVQHANLVVAVDAGAGHEVVGHRDAPDARRLRVRAVGPAGEVVLRAPVGTAGCAVG